MQKIVDSRIMVMWALQATLGCTLKQESRSFVREDQPTAANSDVMSGVEANTKVVFVLDQYKILVANYLADNQSVSSIPANYRALGLRHAQWLAGFTNHVKDGSPAWDKVRDITSYEAGARHIQKVADAIPSDENLVVSSTRFVTDIIRTDEILAWQQQYLSQILSSYVRMTLAEALGPTFTNMRSQLKKTITDIAAYRRILRTMKVGLTNMQERRSWLKTQVPDAWQRILEYRLVRANSAVARELIDEINAAISGESVAAEIMGGADHILATVRHSYEQFAPYLTRRAVFGGLAGVERLRQRVVHEQMSNATRDQLKVYLDGVASRIENYRANAGEMMRDKDEYVRERRRIAGNWLSRGGRNDLCRALAKSIAEGAVDGVSLDYDFIRLRTDCM